MEKAPLPLFSNALNHVLSRGYTCDNPLLLHNDSPTITLQSISIIIFVYTFENNKKYSLPTILITNLHIKCFCRSPSPFFSSPFLSSVAFLFNLYPAFHHFLPFQIKNGAPSLLLYAISPPPLSGPRITLCTTLTLLQC